MKKLLFIALSLLSVGSVMCGLFKLEEASVAAYPGMDFEVDDVAGIDAPQSPGLVGPTFRAADDVATATVQTAGALSADAAVGAGNILRSIL